MKRVLIAVDNDPISEKVARVGFDVAKKFNAEIALLSVVDNTNLMTTAAVTSQQLALDIEIELRKNLRLLVEKVSKDRETWTFVKKGKPSSAILEMAEQWQADLIVLGSHGKTGVSHLLLGSVAEKIVQLSKKPLLIIPAEH